MNASDVEILGQERAFQGFSKVDVYRLRHKLYAGGWTKELVRENSVRRPMCACLPVDVEHEQIVLVKQFRLGAYVAELSSPWMTEIPAGLVEPAETPEDVVIREVREETGCDVTELRPIAKYLPCHGSGSEKTYLFCGRTDASNAAGVHGNQHEGEDILVETLSIQDAFAKLDQGGFDNAITLIAMQWLKLNYDDIRKAWRG